MVDEVEQALALGYDRISFADDVFTLDRRRVPRICDEIARRGLRFSWECLGRVDTFDYETALRMRGPAATPSSSASSRATTRAATHGQADHDRPGPPGRHTAHAAGLQVGAFFIVYYPGESDDTVLHTLRFAGSLPLDYLGLTMPYPLPGTALLRRSPVARRAPGARSGGLLVSHALTFDGDFSATKMRFAILKGRMQFALKRRLGACGPGAAAFEAAPSDRLSDCCDDARRGRSQGAAGAPAVLGERRSVSSMRRRSQSASMPRGRRR